MRNQFILLASLIILLTGCSKDEPKDSAEPSTGQQTQTDQSSGSSFEMTITEDQVQLSGIPFDLGDPVTLGGINYRPAKQWTTYPPAGMRKGIYSYGPLEEDIDSATVLVFYFGSSGGTIEANLERWIAQWSLPDGRDPHTATLQHNFEVDGMTVHILTLMGTYASGSMSTTPVAKENYRLVAAIIEAPEGNVFFKLTGPDYTSRVMIEAFMSMIKDIKKA